MMKSITPRLAALVLAALVVAASGPAGSLPLAAAQIPPAHSVPAADAALHDAELALRSGNLDEALAKCREVLKLQPESARAYYLTAVIALQRGDQDEAKKNLLQSIQFDPSLGAAHLDLGRLYFQSKQWHSAEIEFQAAQKLGDATGNAEFGWGLALVADSRTAEALPHLAAAVQLSPKNSEGRFTRLFTLMAAEFEVKQLVPARRHLAGLEQLSPRNPALYYRVGSLFKQQHMLDDADKMLERSADLLAEGESSPMLPQSISDIRLEIARLRFERHDYSGALQSLGQFDGATADPHAQAFVREVEGATLLAAGKPADAQQKLREAVRLDPSNPDLFFRCAWALLMAGDLNEAARMASAADRQWPQDPEVPLLFAVLERERLPKRAHVPFTADWHLRGEGMVCCPCNVPCPCRSNGHPTHRHCENTGVFHIAQGHYGGVSLDGFTFASIDADMAEGGLPAALYVNASATDEQLIALERIFQSFEPIKPFLFLDVKRLPLSLARPDVKTYEVHVSGLFDIKIRRDLDDTGKPLLETAAIDNFSNRLEYARNLIYKVWDANGGLRWDYSGRQANFRTIDLDARDYRDRAMLAQFTDGSGFFNRKQLDLIKSQGLPTLPSYPNSTGHTAGKTCTGQ
jgi:Flp pilus assembly protein TadD